MVLLPFLYSRQSCSFLIANTADCLLVILANCTERGTLAMAVYKDYRLLAQIDVICYTCILIVLVTVISLDTTYTTQLHFMIICYYNGPQLFKMQSHLCALNTLNNLKLHELFKVFVLWCERAIVGYYTLYKITSIMKMNNQLILYSYPPNFLFDIPRLFQRLF